MTREFDDFLSESAKQFQAETPQREAAMIAHDRSIKKLRVLGIASLIEEEAGTRIPPLAKYDAEGNATAVYAHDYKGRRSEAWRLSAMPQKNEDNDFGNALVIRAEKNHNFKEISAYDTSYDVSEASFTYIPNPDDNSGVFTTSSGYINVLNDKITKKELQKITSAVRRAFRKPATHPSEKIMASL